MADDRLITQCNTTENEAQPCVKSLNVREVAEHFQQPLHISYEELDVRNYYYFSWCGWPDRAIISNILDERQYVIED